MKKFIITSDGLLKFGDVSMHKDLLAEDEYCLGGGYYDFDYVFNRLLLSGKSYDFGRPRWLKLDALQVPKSLEGLRILYEGIDLPIPIKYV
ncbi:MAG: hypothetical protein LUD17_09870 [Bacteroidales bacterium]|nr:hypothetical protein [Bacteroidales bacterium]